MIAPMFPLQRRNRLDGKELLNIDNGKGTSDIDLLWDIQRRIEGNTICPLGDQQHGWWYQLFAISEMN
jgi:hypothetical protein